MRRSAMRSALKSIAGVGGPSCGHRGHCFPARRPFCQCNRCNDFPFDQAAADDLVCSHPSDRGGGLGQPRWTPAQGQAGPWNGNRRRRFRLLKRARRGRRQPPGDPHRLRTQGRPPGAVKWVNTALGNIKSAIAGTCRKLGPDHAERHRASFAWRCNRRCQLQTMIPRFIHSAARVTQSLGFATESVKLHV